MNKKLVSSNVIAVALTVLLTACGNFCGKKGAVSTTTSSPVEATAVASKASNVVFFEFDSSKLSDEGKATSKTNADSIKTVKDAKVTVTGHCSEEGSEAYNNGLGERRANSVAESLEADGAGVKTEVVSYGKSADFGEGLEKNRRAVIHTGEVAGIPNGKVATKKAKADSKKRRMKKAKKSKTAVEATVKTEAAEVSAEAPKAEVATESTAA